MSGAQLTIGGFHLILVRPTERPAVLETLKRHGITPQLKGRGKPHLYRTLDFRGAVVARKTPVDKVRRGMWRGHRWRFTRYGIIEGDALRELHAMKPKR